MALNEAINEEIREEIKNKNVADLNEKHFSRFGEFVASFELSKYGWNVYSPVYDEYIDFVIHKYVCQNCEKLWTHAPILICKNRGKDYSKTKEKKTIATGVCLNCKAIITGGKKLCKNCQQRNVEHRATCIECKGVVEMKELKCECGSDNYKTLVRTIQVKSSRIEFDKKKDKSKNQYAIDMKPKDLIEDDFHFFIWCLIDDVDKPHFLVMSVKEFIDTMGDSLKGVSYLKDDDRQHFNSNDFGRWKDFYNKFDKLE